MLGTGRIDRPSSGDWLCPHPFPPVSGDCHNSLRTCAKSFSYKFIDFKRKVPMLSLLG